MAYYLVKAKPLTDLAELRARLDDGEIEKLRPFGSALSYSLLNARQAGWPGKKRTTAVHRWQWSALPCWIPISPI
jgi:hypothetical protein